MKTVEYTCVITLTPSFLFRLFVQSLRNVRRFGRRQRETRQSAVVLHFQNGFYRVYQIVLSANPPSRKCSNKRQPWRAHQVRIILRWQSVTGYHVAHDGHFGWTSFGHWPQFGVQFHYSPVVRDNVGPDQFRLANDVPGFREYPLKVWKTRTASRQYAQTRRAYSSALPWTTLVTFVLEPNLWPGPYMSFSIGLPSCSATSAKAKTNRSTYGHCRPPAF